MRVIIVIRNRNGEVLGAKCALCAKSLYLSCFFLKKAWTASLLNKDNKRLKSPCDIYSTRLLANERLRPVIGQTKMAPLHCVKHTEALKRYCNASLLSYLLLPCSVQKKKKRLSFDVAENCAL